MAQESTTIEVDLQEITVMTASIRRGLPKVLAAAAHGARVASITHFQELNMRASAESLGFPLYGQPRPKSNLWADIAKSIGAAEVKDGVATVPIDSKIWAHKADTNPPVITPKGGRRFLALPANARSAAWEAMPRDFLGGELEFGYATTPDGKVLPALLAKRNHLRTVKKGAKAGQRVMAKGKQAKEGQGEAQYWLVRKAQTRHDPRAIPPNDKLTVAAQRAAADAVDVLLAKGAQHDISNRNPT